MAEEAELAEEGDEEGPPFGVVGSLHVEDDGHMSLDAGDAERAGRWGECRCRADEWGKRRGHVLHGRRSDQGPGSAWCRRHG
ncbi:hypothetical protein GUJ93_ZPchr0011g28811 [Zizania palustris]|uniref:Uncharacterized protein n=1 Tax=Zizania palustris TaxID=103762 RepID=A0A8J5WFQ1_ZIZPA|nr:hypothetical protein GUJ93_ZPchr0011g28811 [Zizania palustris]